MAPSIDILYCIHYGVAYIDSVQYVIKVPLYGGREGGRGEGDV